MSNQEKQQVEQIRDEYTSRQKTKLDELTELNAKVKRPAEIFAYSFGTIGALVLGAGMSLAMTEWGAGLAFAMPLGITIGVVGLLMVGVNYWIYRKILKNRKNNYAGQVLALTDELLQK